MKKADVNANNRLTKVSVIQNLLGISVCGIPCVGIPVCECEKSCDIGQYLEYRICNCRKKLISKLVKECSENINENEMTYIMEL